jgi:hypothetical protein
VTFFDAFALVDQDAGGFGNFANEPSPDTVLHFPYEQGYMMIPEGFTEFSFWYASKSEAIISVLEGPDGDSAVVASTYIPKTGICGRDGIPPCGDPTGAYGVWQYFTLPFAGVAHAIRFTYARNFILDDMFIVQGEPPPPPCDRTTYWLWDAREDTNLGELPNNTVSCWPVPYNIEVRPCGPVKTTPVFISLKNATLGTIKTQNEFVAPFFLWGDEPATGDVFNNKKPMPKGTYWLYSRVDDVLEKITFTKTC